MSACCLACLSFFHAAGLHVAVLPTFISACLACLKSKISFRACFQGKQNGNFFKLFQKTFTSSERFCLFQASVVSKQNFCIFTNVFENENKTLAKFAVSKHNNTFDNGKEQNRNFFVFS
jgi:hypothetical protein